MRRILRIMLRKLCAVGIDYYYYRSVFVRTYRFVQSFAYTFYSVVLLIFFCCANMYDGCQKQHYFNENLGIFHGPFVAKT